MGRLGKRSAVIRVGLPAVGIVGIGILLGWAIIAWLAPGASKREGCTLPTTAVKYQDLQCHPEAHLVYPGSTEYQSLAASETTDPFAGTNPAFSGAILISTDSAPKIYAWYDSWLKSHGWYRAPLLGAGYLSSHGYARGRAREAFNVDIDDPARLSATLGRRVPSGGTVFEVVYLAFPYRASATPAPSCAPTPEPSGLLSSFYCNP